MAGDDTPMASDSCDCDTSDTDGVSPSPLEADKAKAGRRQRHTPSQLATLNAYYKFGMVGVGKNYLTMIAAASKDCNLSEKKN